MENNVDVYEFLERNDIHRVLLIGVDGWMEWVYELDPEDYPIVTDYQNECFRKLEGSHGSYYWEKRPREGEELPINKLVSEWLGKTVLGDVIICGPNNEYREDTSCPKEFVDFLKLQDVSLPDENIDVFIEREKAEMVDFIDYLNLHAFAQHLWTLYQNFSNEEVEDEVSFDFVYGLDTEVFLEDYANSFPWTKEFYRRVLWFCLCHFGWDVGWKVIGEMEEDGDLDPEERKEVVQRVQVEYDEFHLAFVHLKVFVHLKIRNGEPIRFAECRDYVRKRFDRSSEFLDTLGDETLRPIITHLRKQAEDRDDE